MAMPLQAFCLGHRIDVWTPRTGVVHSAFGRAVNLLVEGELWTVLGDSRQDAPFGIRLAPKARDGRFAVQASDGVHVRAGFVGMGALLLDCRMASRWTPRPWNPPGPGLDSRLRFLEQRAFPRAWSGSLLVARELVGALEHSEAALARAVARSVGRGPGLTPSGDDVLAGMLTVLTCAAAGPAGTEAAARLARALAPALASTGDVSRHLLSQAARGLPGRALHELGWALLEDGPEPVLSDAIELVLDTGATSGADACLGLAAACRLLFSTPKNAAA